MFHFSEALELTNTLSLSQPLPCHLIELFSAGFGEYSVSCFFRAKLLMIC